MTNREEEVCSACGARRQGAYSYCIECGRPYPTPRRLVRNQRPIQFAILITGAVVLVILIAYIVLVGQGQRP